MGKLTPKQLLSVLTEPGNFTTVEIHGVQFFLSAMREKQIGGDMPYLEAGVLLKKIMNKLVQKTEVNAN